MTTVSDVQFEQYHEPNTFGVHETKPRLSWKLTNAPSGFRQHGYEVELSVQHTPAETTAVSTVKHTSALCTLVSWPFDEPLQSRQRVSVRVRVWDEQAKVTDWSEPARLEVGLLNRATDWTAQLITAPWAPSTSTSGPQPEQLFRKPFSVDSEASIDRARLYITAQGVYEAEINGGRIGDHFLAPGWTAYDGRLQYQTYDVTGALQSTGANCLGVRIAEGWFCGRIGFEGGHRNIWGPHPALMAQLEITYSDGSVQGVCTDASWSVTSGPIRLAEIYDGEKYDATLEVPSWSCAAGDNIAESAAGSRWEPALVLPPLPDAVQLTAGFGEPVRRVETLQPVEKMTTPLGKTIVDFGQNLVGYIRVKKIRGARHDKITLSHAEVLENGELGTRPLRICRATDEYTLKGTPEGESYEPRFTFHGFRYLQVDGWPGDLDLLASVEAVVCHTDMKPAGDFACSEPLLNQLYQNVRWGMRGNFLSVPTDCPQRDERMGWTGDLALFAPTAVLIYDCFNMLRNWLIDVEHDQGVLGGVPPMVSPNATLPDPVWCRRLPCAIWHDVTILGPWALYEETGDVAILAQQHNSMLEWMRVLPRSKSGTLTHLWDPAPFQLGDWLDPAAPPDQPWKSATDAKMVANMFLVQSLDLMSRISSLLNRSSEHDHFTSEAALARAEFHREYVTPTGRLVSDTQAAYALAISLDILTPSQLPRAAARLAELVRKANFCIATGFAATPYLCEALASTGHLQVAFAALLQTRCPSWLYPVTMGATTVWERWDGLLPPEEGGGINPGEMTSFNHYALGAVAKFMHERIAGLRRLEPGWTRCRVEPAVGARFVSGSAEHETLRGRVSCRWSTTGMGADSGEEVMRLSVCVPYGTAVEVVLPTVDAGQRREEVGHGTWEFETTFKRDYEWPVVPLKPKSN
ncbi:glycoside hydrolase family 78 protein [Parathielavia hyrcaniae]|uniref:alpha-L-rhamnosidase n=1 Tax=Parathielavia hyrcaniae TaxID=113614 RepID=A0AAN6PU37_9PEZI|nr:glycoside hydrolase family 78 protein [Parathielavia hyrcaniae]